MMQARIRAAAFVASLGPTTYWVCAIPSSLQDAAFTGSSRDPRALQGESFRRVLTGVDLHGQSR